MEEKNLQNNNCCRKKAQPRSEESVRKLENRINRMIGQLGGIRTMLRENRYCGDILVQVAAVESALLNLGYIILEEHMASCVSTEIRAGNEEIIAETMELVKKLK